MKVFSAEPYIRSLLWETFIINEMVTLFLLLEQHKLRPTMLLRITPFNDLEKKIRKDWLSLLKLHFKLERVWTCHAKLRDSPLKGVRAPKPIQNQVSTIHFLLSDSLNKCEECLEGSRCTLKNFEFSRPFLEVKSDLDCKKALVKTSGVTRPCWNGILTLFLKRSSWDMFDFVEKSHS